jgi:serine/threonine protein phosphatase 1
MAYCEAQNGHWQNLPEGISADEPLLIIPDVHGEAALLEHLLADFDRVTDSISDYTVVYLGDLIDRGPENFRTIELARQSADVFGKHVMLPGNHELMLLDGLSDMFSFQLWFQNGGMALCDELPGPTISKPSELVNQVRDALPAGYLELLKNSTTHFQSGNFICVHAGLCPMTREDWKAQREEFLAKDRLDFSGEEHWAWIRSPFLEWQGGWDPQRRDVVVHGHTVMCPQRLHTVEQAASVADALHAARRFSLDIGSVFYGHMLALEIRDGRYRFHFVKKTNPLD